MIYKPEVLPYTTAALTGIPNCILPICSSEVQRRHLPLLIKYIPNVGAEFHLSLVLLKDSPRQVRLSMMYTGRYRYLRMLGGISTQTGGCAVLCSTVPTY